MKNFIYAFSLFAFGACNNSVELEPVKSSKTSLLGGEERPQSAMNNGIINSRHVVRVIDHIPGNRYSYLKVEENQKQYWLATMGGEFTIGADYEYSEGIEKMDYTSTELSKTFDRILLISALNPVHAHSGSAHAPKQSDGLSNNAPITFSKNSIRIQELVDNKAKYNGKIVEVSGRVTKVNPNIMDRNWIHLSDGSKNDFDFVCTSLEAFPVGHVVTLKGKLVLNKDFGAGYRYDLIIENAETVK